MSNHHKNLTAEQIRQRMNSVRHELNDDMEQVVEDANSLGDVRAYVKAQPIGWLVAASVAGFLAVPSRKETPADAQTSNFIGSGSPQAEPARKRSMIGAAFGMAATMGTRLVMKRLASAGMGLFDQPRQNQPSSAHHSDASLSNHEPSSS